MTDSLYHVFSCNSEKKYTGDFAITTTEEAAQELCRKWGCYAYYEYKKAENNIYTIDGIISHHEVISNEVAIYYIKKTDSFVRGYKNAFGEEP